MPSTAEDLRGNAYLYKVTHPSVEKEETEFPSWEIRDRRGNPLRVGL